MSLVAVNAATGHTADQGRCLQTPGIVYFKTQLLDEVGLPERTKHEREDSLNQESSPGDRIHLTINLIFLDSYS